MFFQLTDIREGEENSIFSSYVLGFFLMGVEMDLEKKGAILLPTRLFCRMNFRLVVVVLAEISG
jgi:hypothetical protein